MLDAFPLEPDIIEKKYPNADKYNYNTSVIYIDVSGYNFFHDDKSIWVQTFNVQVVTTKQKCSFTAKEKVVTAK